MALVLVIRDFPADMTLEEIKEMSEEGAGCYASWNVSWVQSFRDPNTNRMLCFFEAPDAESVRIAVRQSGWTGDALVKSMTHIKTDQQQPGTVVVERQFEVPTKFADLQAKEDEKNWCLTQHQVSFVESFFSIDHKTMVCIYQAPDAEAVRNAQRQADMPHEKVWSCQRLNPALFT